MPLVFAAAITTGGPAYSSRIELLWEWRLKHIGYRIKRGAVLYPVGKHEAKDKIRLKRIYRALGKTWKHIGTYRHCKEKQVAAEIQMQCKHITEKKTLLNGELNLQHHGIAMAEP